MPTRQHEAPCQDCKTEVEKLIKCLPLWTLQSGEWGETNRKLSIMLKSYKNKYYML